MDSASAVTQVCPGFLPMHDKNRTKIYNGPVLGVSVTTSVLHLGVKASEVPFVEEE